MSSAQFNAGETHGQAQVIFTSDGGSIFARTEEWVQSAKSTANKSCDKLADSRESAQHGKEQSAGFLQQTGEQVIHMAQGAIDGVKNTLGINNEKK